MTQEERRLFLLRALLAEEPRWQDITIPADAQGQRDLLRSLMNVRPPKAIAPEVLAVQDAYLQEESRRKGIVELSTLNERQSGLYLWQGDITRLACDAIVNAANEQMLGCFVPCHGCIDNAIHTYAGMQLRLACAEQMHAQGHAEPVGLAKLTSAYNLPSRYILHTVGPLITAPLTKRDRQLLAACYRSCFRLAQEHQLKSIAFCCISTGEFHFPNDVAAQIAITTIQSCRAQTNSEMKVIFNVFKEKDRQLYEQLL